MTASKVVQARTAKIGKEERARDAALAMQEYEAERLAVRAKTARLRALRLANERTTTALAEPKTRAKAKR
jgi:hypothetical protein